MFVNAIVNNCSASAATIYGNQPKFFSNQISFCSSKDVFEKSPIAEKHFAQELDLEVQKQILDKIIILLNNLNKIKTLGTGASGEVYRIKGVKGFENGLAVKISHTDTKNIITGEQQVINNDFGDEKDILKNESLVNSNSQHYVGDIKLTDGRNILITTFVKGRNPEVTGPKLNSQNLASLLATLENLDEQGILHRDLKKENIIISPQNEPCLIDFGEAISFDIRDVDYNDLENNFPCFEAPSNIRNLEDTLISSYMNDLMKKNPKECREFFRKYLSLKSEFIHSKKADYIKNILMDDSSLSNEQRQALEEMENYQRLMAKILKNPSEDVIDIELMKNQITYNSELAYKNEVLLGNPLANIALKTNALISAKKLEAMCEKQIQRPNSLERKEYFEYQYKYARYRQKRIAGWLNGLVGWVTSCLSTDNKTASESQKRIINECLDNNSLTDFEIPTIVQDK